MNRLLRALYLGGLIAITSTPVLAQTQVKTGTLGGGGSGGGAGLPIMTRDELRTCLKQQVALKDMSNSYDAKKAQLASDRDALLADSKAISGDLESARANVAKVDDLNRRTAGVAEKVNEWNSRWAEFQGSKRTGPIAERQRRKLIQEQSSLAEEGKALDAEREQMLGGSDGAAEANAKSEALNARTVAWNQRNVALVKEGENLTNERELWASECGNRRFREDDEIAIRQGK
jgi:hypothetical protein